MRLFGHNIKRAEITIAVVAASAVYFGAQVFLLHHELYAHGFELSAGPLIDRVLSVLCHSSE
jgi:hypothetical protein